MIIVEWLKGRKTYLVAAAMVVVSGLHGMKYIDDTTFNMLMGLLGGAGFATLKASHSAIEQTITTGEMKKGG